LISQFGSDGGGREKEICQFGEFVHWVVVNIPGKEVAKGTTGKLPILLKVDFPLWVISPLGGGREKGICQFGDFVHWVVVNIPGGEVAKGTRVG